MSTKPADEFVWTAEARARLERAPDFVRPGIVKLMARRCRERGRTVVDSEFLTEIRNESMLLVAKCIRGFGLDHLSPEAFAVARARMRKLPRKLEVIDRIEQMLAARTEKNTMVLAKFARYLEMIPAQGGLLWTEEALARLQRVPEGVRPLVARMIESTARQARERLVSGTVVDRCLARSPGGGGPVETAPRADGAIAGVTMLWTAEAEERLRRIPLESVRRLVIRGTEAHARGRGLDVVDAAIFEEARAARLPPGTESAAEIERLKAENERLKAQRTARVSLKVSAKGAVSLYGLGRFPVTLYKEQWAKLLGMADEILGFIREHDAELKAKEPRADDA